MTDGKNNKSSNANKKFVRIVIIGSFLVMLILGIACISFAMTWSFTIANIGSQMASKVASVGSGIQNAKNSGIVTNLQ